ncbi:O-antigen ligase family protein [Clostridium hydrogeniformans]|uniref:O-antigen ligase family protein n=1 Tax=Clostridium hydrogeniformans TaxID=349933 RepID=UPI000482F291|nr:O-antigen ligase family protein [Clostridium hydrogeniformans]
MILDNIDIVKQRLYFKIAFVMYALFFTTELSLKGNFTIIKLLIIAWGMALILLDIYNQKTRILKKFNILLNLFIMINILSLIIYPSKAYNLRIFLITLIQLGVLNNSEITQTPQNTLKEIRRINFNFVFISFIISAISLYMFFTKTNLFGIAFNEASRPDLLKGLFIISNTGGMVSFLSLVISFLSIRSTKFFSIFYGINILVQGSVLYLTRARASWVGLIVFIIVYGFINIRSKSIRRVIIASLMILTITFPIYKPYVMEPLNGFINKTAGQGFFSGRLNLWEEGYEKIFKKNPVLGVGYKDVVDIMKKDATRNLPGIEGGRLHNIYLEITYSHGIIAAILMILFFIVNGYSLYKTIFKIDIPKEYRNIMKFIFSMFISLYVMSFVESSLLYVISVVSAIFWIYIGYSEYFIKKYKKF